MKNEELHQVHEQVKNDDVAMWASEEDLLIYDHFFRKGMQVSIPDKPVPEQEDKWDGKCLICLIRKLGYKIRIDNFKHTCSLKDYDS